MPRFFVEKDAVSSGEVSIFGDDAYHIARALRMAVGDKIEISDCSGTDYICELTYIRDNEARAAIISSAPSGSESPVGITLYMAYPKGDKLEWVVQKATELGVTRIVPFESERVIKRPPKDKMDKTVLRLTRIAHEAAKQSGRSILPTVDPVLSFSAMCEELSDYDLSIFCYEAEGSVSLRDVLVANKSARRIAAIVGCEGGFTVGEAESIVEAGGVSVGLGPRILRCETAPEYVLSALSYEFEM